MFDVTLLFIYEKNQNINQIKESLDNYASKFKKVIIGTKKPEKILDLDYEIVMPINEESLYSILYTALLFSGEEKIAVVSAEEDSMKIDEISILLKNFHNGVDAAMFMVNNEISPFPGVYSKKIINKFKDSDPEKLDETFLKRLKINKILRK